MTHERHWQYTRQWKRRKIRLKKTENKMAQSWSAHEPTSPSLLYYIAVNKCEESTAATATEDQFCFKDSTGRGASIQDQLVVARGQRRVQSQYFQ